MLKVLSEICPGGVRMSAVVAGAGDVVQPVAVADARFVDAVGRGAARTFADRYVAPTGVGAVVDGIHLAVGVDQQIVRVAETGRVDLHRPAGDDLRLVPAVVAAEGIVRVVIALRAFRRRASAGRRSCCRSRSESIDRIAADRANSGRNEKLFDVAPMLVLPPIATYSVLVAASSCMPLAW